MRWKLASCFGLNLWNPLSIRSCASVAVVAARTDDAMLCVSFLPHTCAVVMLVLTVCNGTGTVTRLEWALCLDRVLRQSHVIALIKSSHMAAFDDGGFRCSDCAPVCTRRNTERGARGARGDTADILPTLFFILF